MIGNLQLFSISYGAIIQTQSVSRQTRLPPSSLATSQCISFYHRSFPVVEDISNIRRSTFNQCPSSTDYRDRFRDIPWRFPIFPASHGPSPSWCRFWPKSYFMVTSTSSICPFIISEVISLDESDRYCMLIQCIAVARGGQYLMKAGEQFFVVGIYLRENLIVERFIVAQTGKKVCHSVCCTIFLMEAPGIHCPKRFQPCLKK